MRTVIVAIMMIAIGERAAQADAFEQHCLPCHRDLPVSLGDMFKKYLEVFSSEKYVKIGLKYYLRHPDRTSSLMTPLFLDTVGVKQPITLDDATLDQAIDAYWERFKVIDMLE